jgi:hypothetical protein
MEVEDIDHLLFNCDFSRKGVDVRIYKWMHVDFFFPFDEGCWSYFLEFGSSIRRKKSVIIVWHLIWMATIWRIWRSEKQYYV